MKVHFHFGGCAMMAVIAGSVFFCIVLMALSSH